MQRTTETPAQALRRIQNSMSPANRARVIAECHKRGFANPMPGENVLTMKAWNAKGRKIVKGEKSITIPKVVETDDGEKLLRMARVFHVDQTEPMSEKHCAYLERKHREPIPACSD